MLVPCGLGELQVGRYEAFEEKEVGWQGWRCDVSWDAGQQGGWLGCVDGVGVGVVLLRPWVGCWAGQLQLGDGLSCWCLDVDVWCGAVVRCCVEVLCCAEV